VTPLEQLVTVIDQAHTGLDTAAWAQVMGSDRTLELVCDDDLGNLLGFVAPDECWALAMSAPGWARSTEMAPDAARAGQQRVRITCAVARDGGVAGRVHWADGSQVDEPPSSGRSLDILRRGLRLPTDPPAAPSGQLLAAQWLEAIRSMVGRRARPLTWAQAASQHPAMRLAKEGGLPVRADDLVTVARLAAAVWCWSELLRQAAAPGALADALPAGVGGWMDEGMLSRWLPASYPPLPEHVAEIVALVMPETGGRIRGALEALDLPASAIFAGPADPPY
jgi:hypothetical protein